MAPTRKRKSDEMAGPTTPEASSTPAPKRMKISQTQKQALIDNLQLESSSIQRRKVTVLRANKVLLVTERARHLRAHYALQCADLKSRIQRRVNRIPMSMRTMTMGELMARENTAKEPRVEATSVAQAQPAVRAQAPPRATRKQKSSIVIAADPVTESSNESEGAAGAAPIPRPVPLPKAKNVKRTGKAGGGVLSPRSHNSRTLPRSPIKGSGTEQTDTSSTDCQPVSPSKRAQTTRPTSPLKPASPLKSAAIATTSAITSSMHNILATAKSTTSRAKAASRLDNAQRTISQASNHSTTSNVTTTSTGTVVKNASRPVRGRTAAAAAATKKSAAATALATKAATAATIDKSVPVTATATKSRTGTVRKGAAAAAASVKKAVTSSSSASATATTTEPAATGRRILRKRN